MEERWEEDGRRWRGLKVRQYQLGSERTKDIASAYTGLVVSIAWVLEWLLDYRSKRLGLKVLQQEIDVFIVDHEAQAEKEQKEREAAAVAEGWTVVVHQKGRKKNVDAESGIVVGSVGLAAAQAKNAKKKAKESAVTFYRFQRREARRNEILELQNKFEEDKKRIAQMRAARKFHPY